MASKARKQSGYSNKDTLFVGRFVYDVLVYTLTKCGFPETRLPTTDCKENVYNRHNLVKIAGVSALRVSLIMREKWKQMFISRRNVSKFSDTDIRDFLGQLVLCCPLSRTKITQSTVELFLASFNEIALFFHRENVDFDFISMIKYTSSYILVAIGPRRNVSETIEGLFDEFENIVGYTRWITNFIKKYAVPYGSRDDVSDIFLERVKKQFRDDMKKIRCSETLSLKKLRDLLGFLPYDLFSTVLVEEPISFLETLQSASRSILSADQESQEASKSSEGSECGGVEERKSRSRRSVRSTNASEEIVQAEENSENNTSELGIEDNLGQMNLAAEDRESPKSPESSETCAVEEKKSRRRQSTRSTNVSEHTAQGSQSSENASDLGIEDDLGQISLAAADVSQERHGAIPKQKTPQTKNKNQEK